MKENKTFELSRQYSDGSKEEPTLHKIDEIHADWMMDRRQFLTTTAVGIAAIGLLKVKAFGGSPASSKAPEEHLEWVWAHLEAIQEAAYTPDRSRMITAAGVGDFFVKCWEAPSGKLISKYQLESSIWALDISPDGKYAAVCCHREPFVRLWNASTGKEIAQIGGAKDDFYSVRFSRDSKLLFCGADEGGTIKVWDIRAGKAVHQLKGHKNRINAMAESPDGKKLVSASLDRSVRVWDIQTGKMEQVLAGSNIVTGLMNGEVKRMFYSDDGTLLATVAEGGGVNVYRMSDGKKIASVKQSGAEYQQICFIPGLRYLAFSSWRKHQSYLSILDIDQGKVIASVLEYREVVFALAASPDGKYLASASSGGEIILRNARTAEKLIQLRETHSKIASSLAFTSDSRILIATSWDKTVRLWEIPSGKVLNSFFDPDTLSRYAKASCYQAQAAGHTLIYTTSCATGEKVPGVCTCNCVEGSSTSYNPSLGGNSGGGGSGGGSYCSCNQVCTCVPVK